MLCTAVFKLEKQEPELGAQFWQYTYWQDEKCYKSLLIFHCLILDQSCTAEVEVNDMTALSDRGASIPRMDAKNHKSFGR